MMKKVSLIFAAFWSLNTFGQVLIGDTLCIQIGDFEIIYSEVLMQPLSVYYVVTCPQESNLDCDSIGWKVSLADELVGRAVNTSKSKHYYKNVWDKGHMIPVASVDCTCENKKSTYTYLNCALQHEDLNNGLWRQLENREREIAMSIDDKVMVEIQVIFHKDSLPISRNGPTIPCAFRKTIVSGMDTISYLLPNISLLGQSLRDFKD
jgi:DNA/RNA endonuclease G (NUC1)